MSDEPDTPASSLPAAPQRPGPPPLPIGVARPSTAAIDSDTVTATGDGAAAWVLTAGDRIAPPAEPERRGSGWLVAGVVVLAGAAAVVWLSQPSMRSETMAAVEAVTGKPPQPTGDAGKPGTVAGSPAISPPPGEVTRADPPTAAVAPPAETGSLAPPAARDAAPGAGAGPGQEPAPTMVPEETREATPQASPVATPEAAATASPEAAAVPAAAPAVIGQPQPASTAAPQVAAPEPSALPPPPPAAAPTGKSRPLATAAATAAAPTIINAAPAGNKPPPPAATAPPSKSAPPATAAAPATAPATGRATPRATAPATAPQPQRTARAGIEPPPARLRPPSVDSADPVQMRAASAGLHPRLPWELLASLSPTDLHNAGVAIQTALAEAPDGATFRWPRRPWPDDARYEVRVVPSRDPACRRYVVTVIKDGWANTAPPMETCDSPASGRSP